MRGPLLVMALGAVACAPSSKSEDSFDATPARPPLGAGASTLAGWAEAGDVDGPRAVNLFANPVGVALAADGSLLVADFDNGKIRAVDATGTASTAYSDPSFARPFALAPRGSSVYVATDDDPQKGHGPMSGTLWKVEIGGTARVIAPRIGRPRGITVLPDGRLVVADYTHHVVELVDPTTGEVSLLAGGWDEPGLVDGTGAAARFDIPYAIAVRPDGSLLVTDQGNHRLREISLAGDVTTLSPIFDRPQGLAITAAGDVYVSDIGTARILRVRADVVETIAGDGQAGYADALDPLTARFYGLEGIAVSPDGATLYAADGSLGEPLPYNRIRAITLPR